MSLYDPSVTHKLVTVVLFHHVPQPRLHQSQWLPAHSKGPDQGFRMSRAQIDLVERLLSCSQNRGCNDLADPEGKDSNLLVCGIRERERERESRLFQRIHWIINLVLTTGTVPLGSISSIPLFHRQGSALLSDMPLAGPYSYSASVAPPASAWFCAPLAPLD